MEKAMLEWFRRRGQRPKRLSEMTPDELDAMLADHPQLDSLLRHTLGVMQFAPPKVAESVLHRIEEIVDETLRRRLSPDEEQAFVMQELETIRRMLAGQ
jgi:hypothetical protein